MKKRPRFDGLVLDVQLGGMSGVEVGRRLLVEGGCAPFIYITAIDDPQTRAEDEASGCAAYFRKTDAGADVLDAVRRLAS